MIHHVVFIPTLGFNGCIFDWGHIGNALSFFISGLPGAITYFVLFAQRLHHLPGWNEKRITTNFTIYLRLPGIVAVNVIACECYAHGRAMVPLLALVVQCTLSIFNALYYARQSTLNYARHRLLKSKEPDASNEFALVS